LHNENLNSSPLSISENPQKTELDVGNKENKIENSEIIHN